MTDPIKESPDPIESQPEGPDREPTTERAPDPSPPRDDEELSPELEPEPTARPLSVEELEGMSYSTWIERPVADPDHTERDHWGVKPVEVTSEPVTEREMTSLLGRLDALPRFERMEFVKENTGLLVHNLQLPVDERDWLLFDWTKKHAAEISKSLAYEVDVYQRARAKQYREQMGRAGDGGRGGAPVSRLAPGPRSESRIPMNPAEDTWGDDYEPIESRIAEEQLSGEYGLQMELIRALSPSERKEAEDEFRRHAARIRRDDPEWRTEAVKAFIPFLKGNWQSPDMGFIEEISLMGIEGGADTAGIVLSYKFGMPAAKTWIHGLMGAGGLGIKSPLALFLGESAAAATMLTTLSKVGLEISNPGTTGVGSDVFRTGHIDSQHPVITPSPALIQGDAEIDEEEYGYIRDRWQSIMEFYGTEDVDKGVRAGMNMIITRLGLHEEADFALQIGKNTARIAAIRAVHAGIIHGAAGLSPSPRVTAKMLGENHPLTRKQYAQWGKELNEYVNTSPRFEAWRKAQRESNLRMATRQGTRSITDPKAMSEMRILEQQSEARLKQFIDQRIAGTRLVWQNMNRRLPGMNAVLRRAESDIMRDPSGAGMARANPMSPHWRVLTGGKSNYRVTPSELKKIMFEQDPSRRQALKVLSEQYGGAGGRAYYDFVESSKNLIWSERSMIRLPSGTIPGLDAMPEDTFMFSGLPPSEVAKSFRAISAKIGKYVSEYAKHAGPEYHRNPGFVAAIADQVINELPDSGLFDRAHLEETIGRSLKMAHDGYSELRGVGDIIAGDLNSMLESLGGTGFLRTRAPFVSYDVGNVVSKEDLLLDFPELAKRGYDKAADLDLVAEAATSRMLGEEGLGNVMKDIIKRLDEASDATLHLIRDNPDLVTPTIAQSAAEFLAERHGIKYLASDPGDEVKRPWLYGNIRVSDVPDLQSGVPGSLGKLAYPNIGVRPSMLSSVLEDAVAGGDDRIWIRFSDRSGERELLHTHDPGQSYVVGKRVDNVSPWEIEAWDGEMWTPLGLLNPDSLGSAAIANQLPGRIDREYLFYEDRTPRENPAGRILLQPTVGIDEIGEPHGTSETPGTGTVPPEKPAGTGTAPGRKPVQHGRRTDAEIGSQGSGEKRPSDDTGLGQGPVRPETGPPGSPPGEGMAPGDRPVGGVAPLQPGAGEKDAVADKAGPEVDRYPWSTRTIPEAIGRMTPEGIDFAIKKQHPGHQFLKSLRGGKLPDALALHLYSGATSRGWPLDMVEHMAEAIGGLPDEFKEWWSLKVADGETQVVVEPLRVLREEMGSGLSEDAGGGLIMPKEGSEFFGIPTVAIIPDSYTPSLTEMSNLIRHELTHLADRLSPEEVTKPLRVEALKRGLEEVRPLTGQVLRWHDALSRQKAPDVFRQIDSLLQVTSELYEIGKDESLAPAEKKRRVAKLFNKALVTNFPVLGMAAGEGGLSIPGYISAFKGMGDRGAMYYRQYLSLHYMIQQSIDFGMIDFVPDIMSVMEPLGYLSGADPKFFKKFMSAALAYEKHVKGPVAIDDDSPLETVAAQRTPFGAIGDPSDATRARQLTFEGPDSSYFISKGYGHKGQESPIPLPRPKNLPFEVLAENFDEFMENSNLVNRDVDFSWFDIGGDPGGDSIEVLIRRMLDTGQALDPGQPYLVKIPGPDKDDASVESYVDGRKLIALLETFKDQGMISASIGIGNNPDRGNFLRITGNSLGKQADLYMGELFSLPVDPELVDPDMTLDLAQELFRVPNVVYRDGGAHVPERDIEESPSLRRAPLPYHLRNNPEWVEFRRKTGGHSVSSDPDRMYVDVLATPEALDIWETGRPHPILIPEGDDGERIQYLGRIPHGEFMAPSEVEGLKWILGRAIMPDGSITEDTIIGASVDFGAADPDELSREWGKSIRNIVKNVGDLSKQAGKDFAENYKEFGQALESRLQEGIVPEPSMGVYTRFNIPDGPGARMELFNQLLVDAGFSRPEHRESLLWFINNRLRLPGHDRPESDVRLDNAFARLGQIPEGEHPLLGATRAERSMTVARIMNLISDPELMPEAMRTQFGDEVLNAIGRPDSDVMRMLSEMGASINLREGETLRDALLRRTDLLTHPDFLEDALRQKGDRYSEEQINLIAQWMNLDMILYGSGRVRQNRLGGISKKLRARASLLIESGGAAGEVLVDSLTRLSKGVDHAGIEAGIDLALEVKDLEEKYKPWQKLFKQTMDYTVWTAYRSRLGPRKYAERLAGDTDINDPELTDANVMGHIILDMLDLARPYNQRVHGQLVNAGILEPGRELDDYIMSIGDKQAGGGRVGGQPLKDITDQGGREMPPMYHGPAERVSRVLPGGSWVDSIRRSIRRGNLVEQDARYYPIMNLSRKLVPTEARELFDELRSQMHGQSMSGKRETLQELQDSMSGMIKRIVGLDFSREGAGKLWVDLSKEISNNIMTADPKTAKVLDRFKSKLEHELPADVAKDMSQLVPKVYYFVENAMYRLALSGPRVWLRNVYQKTIPFTTHGFSGVGKALQYAPQIGYRIDAATARRAFGRTLSREEIAAMSEQDKLRYEHAAAGDQESIVREAGAAKRDHVGEIIGWGVDIGLIDRNPAKLLNISKEGLWNKVGDIQTKGFVNEDLKNRFSAAAIYYDLKQEIGDAMMPDSGRGREYVMDLLRQKGRSDLLPEESKIIVESMLDRAFDKSEAGDPEGMSRHLDSAMSKMAMYFTDLWHFNYGPLGSTRIEEGSVSSFFTFFWRWGSQFFFDQGGAIHNRGRPIDKIRYVAWAASAAFVGHMLLETAYTIGNQERELSFESLVDPAHLLSGTQGVTMPSITTILPDTLGLTWAYHRFVSGDQYARARAARAFQRTAPRMATPGGYWTVESSRALTGKEPFEHLRDAIFGEPKPPARRGRRSPESASERAGESRSERSSER